MPKTTTFNPKYGYTRHEDDKDGICFWCGDPAHNTWDYTPAREIAMYPDILAKMGEKPVAVTACKACISTSLYRRKTHKTFAHKMILFAGVRQKKEEKRKEVEEYAGHHPWQYINEATGLVEDYLDDVLNEYPEIRALKDAWIKENTVKKDEELPDWS